MGLRITVRTRIYPTESEEKIRSAILSLFPDARIRREGDYIVAEAKSIDNFARLLREQRIRDAARGVFLANLRDDLLEFRINKQVATKGRISFSVGDVPLGDITVVVEGENLRDLIEEIAPDTRVQKQPRS